MCVQVSGLTSFHWVRRLNVSNDWSPFPSPEAGSQTAHSHSKVWGFTAAYSGSISSARSFSTRFHSICRLVTIDMSPAGDKRNCLGFFNSSKAFSAPKLVQRFPAVPDDSWPLHSSRLNCRGSNNSRKAPRWAARTQQCPLTSGPSVSLNAETHCNVKNNRLKMCRAKTFPRPSQWGFYLDF